MKSILSSPWQAEGHPGVLRPCGDPYGADMAEELVNRFRLVSEVFTNALQHRRAESCAKLGGEIQQFFAHTPEFCYIVSPDGTILDINDWALRGLGYERRDLVGKPLATIYAPNPFRK